MGKQLARAHQVQSGCAGIRTQAPVPTGISETATGLHSDLAAVQGPSLPWLISCHEHPCESCAASSSVLYRGNYTTERSGPSHVWGRTGLGVKSRPFEA